MATLLVAALAAALLPGAAALRSRTQPDAESEKQPYRQRLGNVEDVVYFGNITVGGQRLKAILDTGSFELVLFSKRCPNCGTSLYNEKASATFKKGSNTKVHAYGSGTCRAQDGYDMVELGKDMAKRQALWLTTECQMPVLSKVGFNAIVGLGPPGQAVQVAENDLVTLEDMILQFAKQHERAPLELTQQRDATAHTLAVAREKPDLLESMGVKTFSACLGRERHSPGYLIWNDQTRRDVRGVMRLQVEGNLTWGVSLKDFGFHEHSNDFVIGCGDGCGAVVDTGTSLFAVPTPIYEEFSKQLQNLGLEMDCSDLHHFPDLVMKIDGQRLRFPPSTYLGNFIGELSAEAKQYVRMDRLGESWKKHPCQLLMMDLGPIQQTTLGPMIVIGMPFFREYYTTFDLGRGRGDRSIFVSPASDMCEPDLGGLISNDRKRVSLRDMPRKVNASALRLPRWTKHDDSTDVGVLRL